MKCAKCGHDVPDSAPSCPWCAAGETTRPEQQQPDSKIPRCPVCGSTSISAVRRGYNPGCGCLGLLLFNWLGLLLGFLGAGDIDMVCHSCGSTWPAKRRGNGCALLLFLILLIIILGICFK